MLATTIPKRRIPKVSFESATWLQSVIAQRVQRQALVINSLKRWILFWLGLSQGGFISIIPVKVPERIKFVIIQNSGCSVRKTKIAETNADLIIMNTFQYVPIVPFIESSLLKLEYRVSKTSSLYLFMFLIFKITTLKTMKERVITVNMIARIPLKQSVIV